MHSMNQFRCLMTSIVCVLAQITATAGPARVADTKVVLIAGRPSHGPGEHEFNAGTKILVECLKNVKRINPVFVAGGWPEDESVFEGARAVVFYMDGGSGHPMIQGKHRLDLMKGLMEKGVGLVCLHYAVEFPKEVKPVLDWLGGYYETGYSTNPINEVEVTPRAGHPITRGVMPFQAKDEWYYRIRFRPGDSRVTPILTTMLPRDKPNLETVAWATERADGGRSFGFTGAHFHKNWGIRDFRTLVLNAILWSAKVNVPRNGVASEVTPEQLAANLDPKK